jgi:hypothetical protein
VRRLPARYPVCTSFPPRIVKRIIRALRLCIAYYLTAAGMVLWCGLVILASREEAFPVGLILLFVAMPFTKVSFLLGKRLAMRRARELMGRDTRSPVLLLRSFQDDRRAVKIMSSTKQFIFFQYFPWNYTTFEEVLVRVSSSYGPVVAIGRPGEMLPPLGAARDWIHNDVWQSRVTELLESCQAVVCVIGEMGSTSGLRWEVELLFKSSNPAKVIFVVPPVSDAIVRQRWRALAALSAGKVPEAIGDELALTFDAQGNPIVLQGQRKRSGNTRRWERDYLHALRSLMPRYNRVRLPRSRLHTLLGWFFPLNGNDVATRIIRYEWLALILLYTWLISTMISDLFGDRFVVLWLAVVSLLYGRLLVAMGDLRDQIALF